MRLDLKRVRLKAGWLIAPVYLLLARPTIPLIAAGAALTILGGLVRAWASGTIHKKQVLATGGPYAHTRNPLYLGSFLVGLGLAVAGGSFALLLVFLGLFGAVYFPTMRAEERQLDALFGEQFRRYAAEVPLFIPRLRPYQPLEPHPHRFRFQRYLFHREYNIALGVLVGFLLLAAKMAWS